MTTAIEQTRSAPGVESRETTNLGPILVATDGTESSLAALHAGALLERHTGAEVVVLTVLEGLPLIASDYGMVIPPLDSDDDRRLARLNRVREQVTEIDTRTGEWKLELRDGDPPAVIARVARELQARVIVIGLGHHNLIDRLFGGETVLHVLRQARTPVLAVPPDFDEMPERMLIATDFSTESVNAGRVAIQLLDSVTSVHLAHVTAQLELQPEAFTAWMTMFQEGIGPAFDRVQQDLALPASVSVETVTRNGKPSRALLDLAESIGADVIVTGSRGSGLVDRILVGSTATGLLRGATCAVLAVPAAGIERDQAWSGANASTAIPKERWAAELESFTKKNLGRLAALEIDDPDLGAQAQERDYPFLGVSWDHQDERVQIMLGDFDATGRHLTRGIGGVTSVDVLHGAADRDQALRIRHGDGQTIMTFAR
jgi:nucleotide-binding universal stress UspA family protein